MPVPPCFSFISGSLDSRNAEQEQEEKLQKEGDDGLIAAHLRTTPLSGHRRSASSPSSTQSLKHIRRRRRAEEGPWA